MIMQSSTFQYFWINELSMSMNPLNPTHCILYLKTTTQIVNVAEWVKTFWKIYSITGIILFAALNIKTIHI